MAALPTPTFLTTIKFPSKNTTKARSHGLHSFLDLTPEYSPDSSIDIDVPWHDASASRPYDAAIIGCGPSGLRLAECASARGLRVCCIDPSPLSLWHNTYGAWVDELEPLGLGSYFDHVWPTATFVEDDDNTKLLNRPYGRVHRRALKTLLLENCANCGVRFHRAKAWSVEHEEFRSTVACSDGHDVEASLVVDAGGYGSNFVTQPLTGRGYQIAHGILAVVDSHPFDLNQLVLMDYRDSHLDNEPQLRVENAKKPTFLYAMPFDANLVFLEETSLVGRPALPYGEAKKRLAARLRHLGIKVKRVIQDEKVLIPMGGPLPRMPQSVVGFGGTAGIVHPSTGYMMAWSMALAPEMADAMAECLGSTRVIRGKEMQRRVWSSLWSEKRRWEREYYCFGMETLLKLDLEGTRKFFNVFFDLEPQYWHGFLSSRLSIWELAGLSLTMFFSGSSRTKADIVSKCPLPLAQMLSNIALQSS